VREVFPLSKSYIYFILNSFNAPSKDRGSRRVMTKAVDACQHSWPHERIISIRQRPTMATLGDPWEYALPLLRVIWQKETQRLICLRKYRWLVWRRYLGFRRELVCSYFGFCGARDVESQTADKLGVYPVPKLRLQVQIALKSPYIYPGVLATYSSSSLMSIALIAWYIDLQIEIDGGAANCNETL